MYASRTSSSRTINKTRESSKSVILTPADVSFMNDEEIGAMLDTIEKLAERQKLCTKTYHFKEAEEAKLTIKELKAEMVMVKRKKIEKRHKEELSQILEAQAQELEKFNGFWDEKMEDFNTEASFVEQEMADKHQEEILSARSELSETLSIKAVKSAEHLRHISMVASLAKTGDFTEADKCLKKCSAFEKQALVKAKAEKEKKIEILVSQLESKKKIELKSLKKKITSGKEQMAKIRNDEYEKLQQKFRNMRQELQSAQQLELSKFNISYKSHAPDEKSYISPKKRGAPSYPLNDFMSSSSISLSTLDKSLDFFENEEGNMMTEPKQSLADALMSEATPKKSGRLEPAKHKRVISLQRT